MSAGAAGQESIDDGLRQRVVRVLPDEPAVAKTFDYLVPDAFGGQVCVGTRVRVPLSGRRVGGWVVATDVAPAPGVKLRPLAKLSGLGPSADLIELARWAAWRWAGRPASFLRTASPERVVTELPAPAARTSWAAPAAPQMRTLPNRDAVYELAGQALRHPTSVLRLPPAADLMAVAEAAARLGNALILAPNHAMAAQVQRCLRRAGVPVAAHPEGWAQGAAGAIVVGTRAAAWAPVGGLSAVVVLDEHDEAHAQEQAPTWHARDVAVERARRAGVPCLLTSPNPSLEALGWGRLWVPSKSSERAGWPIVDVIDRRDDDPRTGLLSSRLVDAVRRTAGTESRVLCVLNRVGRAKLLACAACGELAACEACGAAVGQPERDELVCPRCGTSRPVLCAACGGLKLKVLRQGVSRVREELEALVGEPVGELTGASPKTSGGPGRSAGPGGARGPSPSPNGGAADQPRVMVGTEALLHQVDRAALVVAFLDLDQELLAPRYRAVEQAMALVIRAARLLGGKSQAGRLLLQTRQPRHEVVLAALQADPSRVGAAEAERREVLRFPPVTALAEVSGPAAEKFVAALGTPLGVEVMGPADGRWLLRAPDHRTLCDALAATTRPSGRLRVAVDPLRV